MKLRIIKNKKGYSIILIKHNEIIESFQTNKLDQFYLEYTIAKKIKNIELTLDLVLMYSETFPIISKNKIFKKFNQHFNDINKNKENIVIKKKTSKTNTHIEVTYYYVTPEILEFIINNNMKQKLIRIYNEKILFLRKYPNLINIDEYGIVFKNNNIIKYHYSNGTKSSNNYENIFISLLFVNVNIKKLYILIKKEVEQEYENFIKFLYDNVEERVNIIVEKI